jgi:hypothetical protein
MGRATILIKGIAKRLGLNWPLAQKWRGMAEAALECGADGCAMPTWMARTQPNAVAEAAAGRARFGEVGDAPAASHPVPFPNALLTTPFAPCAHRVCEGGRWGSRQPSYFPPLSPRLSFPARAPANFRLLGWVVLWPHLCDPCACEHCACLQGNKPPAPPPLLTSPFSPPLAGCGVLQGVDQAAGAVGEEQGRRRRARARQESGGPGGRPGHGAALTLTEGETAARAEDTCSKHRKASDGLWSVL